MDIKVSHCFITVTDQDAALEFYRDVLGFQVHTDVPLGDARWLSLHSPSQPGLELVLATPSMGRSPADARALDDLVTKGVVSGVLFSTDDVDKTFERIRASGAEVLQEPTDQPYGVRDCAFRDPSGNHLRFATALG